MKKNLRGTLFIWSFLVWVVTVFLALRWGSVSDSSLDIIFQLRLPRVILASAIGMGLSVAGAALQALFSNPLCEPYTLGISSGSALGAVIGISLNLEWMFAGLAGTAFLGALFFAAILYGLAHRSESLSNPILLLAGVILGFFGSSLVALWLSLSDPSGLQGALAWLFGDLSRARLKGSIFSFAAILIGVIFVWKEWRSLDGLLMGEEGARALGIDLSKIQKRIILLTSWIIGLCVSAGGIIGFIGLVIPHSARRYVGSLHLALIPLCAIWGSIALTCADALSRTLASPYELPVGVVTSLIGSPVLFWILFSKRLH